MAEGLDKSLEDIIISKRINQTTNGQNGNSIKRFRTTFVAPTPQVQQMVADTGLGTEVGTKLYVSNLDSGVSNKDIKGITEVVYTRQSDALAAIKRYNNAHLDGKPMKLELVRGVNFITAAPVPPITGSILGIPNGNVLRQDGNLGRGWDIGGAARHGPGSKREHGRGKGHGEKVSAESLDADLEKYRLEATKTK